MKDIYFIWKTNTRDGIGIFMFTTHSWVLLQENVSVAKELSEFNRFMKLLDMPVRVSVILHIKFIMKQDLVLNASKAKLCKGQTVLMWCEMFILQHTVSSTCVSFQLFKNITNTGYYSLRFRICNCFDRFTSSSLSFFYQSILTFPFFFFFQSQN